MLDMFSYLNCRCDIVRHSRLGVYSSKSISYVRPIKIELRSASEASTLLSRAKYLRNDAFYDGIYINKWLTDEKIRDLKQLRRQCDVLNQKHPSSKKDRKAFVVVSGKIMQRNSYGRLEVYSDLENNVPLSLDAFSKVAKKDEKLSPRLINERNYYLNKLLQEKNLQSTDVGGDGNCFFRAVSVGLCGNQEQHAELRKSVAEHLRKNHITIFAAANIKLSTSDSPTNIAAALEQPDTWVDEIGVLATANYLQRPINFYSAAVADVLTLLSYPPASNALDSKPILLAFI